MLSGVNATLHKASSTCRSRFRGSQILMIKPLYLQTVWWQTLKLYRKLKRHFYIELYLSFPWRSCTFCILYALLSGRFTKGCIQLSKALPENLLRRFGWQRRLSLPLMLSSWLEGCFNPLLFSVPHLFELCICGWNPEVGSFKMKAIELYVVVVDYITMHKMGLLSSILLWSCLVTAG